MDDVQAQQINPLFGIIPKEFFTPLASPNRLVYWDCLCRLFQAMSAQLSFGIEREILVDELQFYFEQNQAAEFEEDDINGMDSRKKANEMLRLLEKYGWLEVETDKSYVQRVNFYDYAVKVMKTLLEISDGRKVEYQGYIYTIYSLVPELTDERLRSIRTVHLVACGTAMHAGMVGKAAIETLARVPAEVDIASEFRYRDPILNKDDLVIIISQSGETSDTLAALRLAKSRGVPVLAVVNVVGSSIARAADYVLYTYAGPEIAVASTKAYMVQLCTLYLFAFRLAYARGRLSEAETRRLTAGLLRAGEVIQPRLADCEQIKYLASRFVNTQSCFFIGRGFDYALSLEGSLKLKEISYVHSDAYAAGELKHGTISLITDGVPVIALATQKQVYEKTISNAKETKSRGARVILFTTKDVVVPEGVADYVVRLDDYDELLMPLQLIVPLQLFAYYMAVLRGCDVDKPRNLAKSVMFMMLMLRMALLQNAAVLK